MGPIPSIFLSLVLIPEVLLMWFMMLLLAHSLLESYKKMMIHVKNSDMSINMYQKSRFLIDKLHSCNYRIFCQDINDFYHIMFIP